jgi:hypothetical protein
VADLDAIESCGIYGALADVMARVGYVYKSGQTTFGDRYTYAGEADLIRALRPAMVQAGVIGPAPRVLSSEVVEHAPTRKGARQFRAEVLVEYVFAHRDGSTFSVTVAGCGVDTGDKVVSKAMTNAYKYALRQTFCIETGDDPDRQSSAAQESPAEAAHDPEWDEDRVRFCAKLREFGLDYDAVKAWGLGTQQGKPSTWTRAGRSSFVRDLIAGKHSDLYQPEPGSAG